MSYRTPVQIENFVKEKSHRLDMAVQYFGDEPNSYRKNWDAASVRMCVFACWAYEQAAGNQAIPLVYKTVNAYKDSFLCDRSYFHSTPRDAKTFWNAGIPVFGVESKHQLADFDVIGTSISYPVLSINFVKQLQESDIPPTWCTREDEDGNKFSGRHAEPERWPMVMVGGQCYGAPEVVANIADVVFCGEVEDEPGNPGLGVVLERIEVMKQDGRWGTERLNCYADLAREFNFLYFPCFVDVHYGYEDRPSVHAISGAYGRETVHPSKQVIGVSSNIDGMRLPHVKRIVKDLNAVAGLTNPPLLYLDPGMGAGDAEVSRGCPAWCTFCALTYRQKPYRQRDVGYMVETTKELVKNTGGLHVAPFGPDFPMHTQKKALISAILENVTDEVDASSMRVDDFIADPSYILLQAHGGMDSVTLGVEGNSQRMRDLVGKGCADEDIKEAVARGIQAGINKFKLYMISALPGEDEGDIFRVMTLAKDLADIRDSMGSNARIQFSWTPMLIEGNTPFQWFAPTASNYALSETWEEFRDLKIDFKLGGKAQRDKILYFQLTQRASREIGLAMVEAVISMSRSGMFFGCWGGAPKGLYERVEDRLVARGFLNGILDAYDERQKHDLFGWEMVDQGINVELLWVTYQQMLEFLENTSSDTYDQNFGDDYHGNEWIERCDTKSIAGSTLIRLADGSVLSIEDLVGRQETLASYDTRTDHSVAAHMPVAWSNGTRTDMLRLHFEDGTSLHCSWDHKVLTTNRGWVVALDLEAEDDVQTAEVPKRLELSQAQIDRFFAHIVKDAETGCWNSTYTPNSTGYTYFYLGDTGGPQRIGMHVVSFEHHVRFLDEGEEPDHKCKNHACVNPAHLQGLAKPENRGQSAEIDRCKKRKHPYTDENTGIQKSSTTLSGYSRFCKACRNIDAQEKRQAAKEMAK